VQVLEFQISLLEISATPKCECGTEGDEDEEAENLEAEASLHYAKAFFFEVEVFGEADHGAASSLE
jgi:hypothetical protein